MAMKLGKDALARGILDYFQITKEGKKKEPEEGMKKVNIQDVCAESYALVHLTNNKIPKNFDMDFAKTKSFQAAGYLESKLKEYEGNADGLAKDFSNIYGNAQHFMGFQ